MSHLAIHKKDKCSFGKCEHKTELMHEEFHDEGVCWKITQEEFADHPTESKYCPCKKHPEFIRRYDRLGYMERSEHDQMITRKCIRCGDDCLFTIHEKACKPCRLMLELEEPIPQ